MKTNICQCCGKEFKSARKKKYCCSSCEKKFRFGIAECLYCGKTFTKSGKDVKCCSISCSKLYEFKDIPKERTKVICSTCGKEFIRRNVDIAKVEARNGKHYCSHACMGEGYKDRITLTCSHCGKEFERARSGVDLSNKHYFCSKKCQLINTDYILKGKDHYRYINGDTSYKRGENWLAARRATRDRDDYTCQICGIKEDELGKLLDVHHKTPYRLFDNYIDANELDNLIALCPSCHHRLEIESLRTE